MKIDWEKFVTSANKEFGFAEFGALELTQSLNDKISAGFAEIDLSQFPEYLLKTTELRSNPLKLFPWAKSVIILAIPFKNIPAPSSFFLPEAEIPELSGKIASYAIKQDYHIYAKDVLAKFAEKFAKFANCEVRTEICVDTSPVAERALANLAGIGDVGLNSCILIKNYGSGCFLGEIFTNLKVSGVRCQVSGMSDSCQNCKKCLKSCPSGAISEDLNFQCSLCRSHLTMEKRGELTKEEIELLGDSIFGCDLCTKCCPDSDIPDTFEIDLKWLLMASSSELKKSINGTALEYAGVTLLQRNALAVLTNKKSQHGLDLVHRFSEKTGSELLKKTADEILSQSSLK